MCQGSEFAKIKSQCICDPKIDDRLLSKKELLTRLKEYKQTLEAELIMVNKNLESTATATEGGG